MRNAFVSAVSTALIAVFFATVICAVTCHPAAAQIFTPSPNSQTPCGYNNSRYPWDSTATGSTIAAQRQRYGPCFGANPDSRCATSVCNRVLCSEGDRLDIQNLWGQLAVCKSGSSETPGTAPRRRIPGVFPSEQEIYDVCLTNSLNRLRQEVARCTGSGGTGGTGGSGSGTGGTSACPAGQTCQGPCPPCPPPPPPATVFFCESRPGTELPPEDVDLVVWGKRWGVFVARRIGNTYWLESGAKWEPGEVLRWLVLPAVL